MGYERYQDVCKDCPLNKPQRDRRCRAPEFEWSQYYLDSDLSLRHAYCRHYTCQEGLKTAGKVAQLNPILKRLIRRTVELDGGEQVKAYPFGTEEKPFEEVERYVTNQGQIITTDTYGTHYISPQQLRPKNKEQ